MRDPVFDGGATAIARLDFQERVTAVSVGSRPYLVAVTTPGQSAFIGVIRGRVKVHRLVGNATIVVDINNPHPLTVPELSQRRDKSMRNNVLAISASQQRSTFNDLCKRNRNQRIGKLVHNSSHDSPPMVTGDVT